MGTGPAWPAARGPPLFRLRTPSADAGPDGLPGRDHPRADQVPELIRARHAGAWAAFADRRAAGEAAVGACDRRGGISASARRTHRRRRRQAARMIGREWKRAGGDRQSPEPTAVIVSNGCFRPIVDDGKWLLRERQRLLSLANAEAAMQEILSAPWPV